MNDELIFVKTSAGEDAVRDRTRLVQRNLRMVLILVDGLTKVSALKQKAGDPAMIETALSELERIGLIESLDTRGERRATSVAEALNSSTPDSHVEQTSLAAHEAEAIDTQDTVFDALVPDPSLDADTEIPDVPTPVANLPIPSAGPASEQKSGWIARVRNSWHQLREERAYEKAYGKPVPEPVSIDVPATRSIAFRAPRLKVRKLVSLLFLMLLVGGFVGIAFYPYDRFRPEIERAASRLMGDEVSIRRVGLTLFPTPALKLDDVALGRNLDIAARTILLVPDIRFLFGTSALFRTAKVSGINIQEQALAKAHAWFPEGAVRETGLESISVENLTLSLGKRNYLLGSGQVTPSYSGGFSLLGLADSGQFRLDAKPTSSGVSIIANTDKWTIPVVPAIPVEALELHGVLSPGQLQIDRFDVRSFDGLVTGKGSLMWGDSSSVALVIDLKHVAAARVLETFHAPGLLVGELDASLQYDSTAPSLAWLGEKERLNGQITVAHGKLNRLDLAGALNPGTSRNMPKRGGETGFEDFSARLALVSNRLELNGAKLGSGLMQANGQASFGLESGQVSGVVGVEMRGSVRAPRATISIGGKASDPELRAGR